jgi:hypothetical protein
MIIDNLLFDTRAPGQRWSDVCEHNNVATTCPVCTGVKYNPMKITINASEWIPHLNITRNISVDFDLTQVKVMGPEILMANTLKLAEACQKSVDAALAEPHQETNT